MGTKLRVVKPLGPVFDKPLWKILPSTDPVNYRLGFCNTVTIAPWEDFNREQRAVYIHTPAELFSYVRVCGWWKAKDIRMMLFCDRNDQYRFCLLIGARVEWLWTYKALPIWAEA